MTNSAAKVYGASALAAMGPVTKVLSVGALAVFGFLKGFQPVAGFSYGAGQLARLREGVGCLQCAGGRPSGPLSSGPPCSVCSSD